jgi:hypothetical protein
MPNDDATFDVIIVGWVLAYSTMPRTAIKEISRVARDGAVVGIGWDFSVFEYEDAELLKDTAGITIVGKTCDIYNLFSLHIEGKLEVLCKHDASYPWDGETRKNIIVLKILKSKLDINSLILREASMYLRLNQTIQNIPEDVSLQLLGHSNRIKFYTNDNSENSSYADYQLLRENYIRYNGTLDKIISQEISKTFPPLFEKSGLGSSVFADNPLLESEYRIMSESLHDSGFCIFPRALPRASLERLQVIFEGHNPESGRAFIDELFLLQNKIISQLLVDRSFLIIAERFLNSTPVLDYVVGMRSVPNIEESAERLHDKQSSDAMLFHFDKDRIGFIKCFIYLSDTDHTNGAHELIPRSQRLRLPRDGRYSDREVSQLQTERPHQIVGAAGTIFFVNTHLLHRGTPVLRGTRSVLQFQYVNSMVGARTNRMPASLFLPESKKMMEVFPRMFMRYHV